MKKIWEKPKLIVLVRNNPQEAVLSGCKYTIDLAGPSSYYPHCYQNWPDYGGCGACAGYTTS